MSSPSSLTGQSQTFLLTKERLSFKSMCQPDSINRCSFPELQLADPVKITAPMKKALIRLFLPDSCLISLSRPLSGRKTLIRGHGFVESLACHEQRECSSSFVLDVVQHSGALISSSGSCTHVGSRPPPPSVNTPTLVGFV